MGQNWNNKGKKIFKLKNTQGIWVPPENYGIPYWYYQVEIQDVGRLENISYKIYGSEQYFWVIAQFNNILDPFNGFNVGQILKVPDLSYYLKKWTSAGYRV